MRERKLEELAGSLNYPAGGNPWNGAPTKIAPPTDYVANGKTPGDAFAAQWQNYIENTLHRQIEISAQLPFRNFIEVPFVLVPSSALPPRFAFNRLAGATLITNGANNNVKYAQEFADLTSGSTGFALTPAAGTFVPRDVVAVDSNISQVRWIVCGSNAGAPTKTLWSVGGFNGIATEITAPVSGSIELITKDRTTGKLYAFAADANNSVLECADPAFAPSTWTVIGARGAGADTPSTSSFYCAANNGVLIFASPLQGVHNVEKLTLGPFVRAAYGINNADTTTLLDVRWSPQHRAFMTQTQTATYLFADPAGAVNTRLPNFNMNLQGGCLTDTGPAGWITPGFTGGATVLSIDPWVVESAFPFMLKFGNFLTDSTGVSCRFDGSAIWFIIDKSGTKRMFRSLRSN